MKTRTKKSAKPRRVSFDNMEDIYGRDKALKEALKIGGVNVEQASRAAIRTDRAAHFMCNYDGNYETSPSGFVYWRHN